MRTARSLNKLIFVACLSGVNEGDISDDRLFFFFFQAEDGIRDHCVTGVQTCALPIYRCLSEDCLELGGIYAVRVHQCRYDWLRQKLFKRRLAPAWRSPIPDVSTPTQ